MRFIVVLYTREHFINNVHYYFTDMYILIVDSISLQSFYVVLLLLNNHNSTFREICYSIKGTLLFSHRVAWVPLQKYLAGRKKWCPHTSYFNLGKSRSLLDSCLNCIIREATFLLVLTQKIGQNLFQVRVSIVPASRNP